MSEYKKVMLISPDTVKATGNINYNVDDEVVGAAIRTAQNIYLVDVLSPDFVNKLQELVYNSIKGLEDNIDSPQNAHFKEFLDDYIKEAMSYKATAEICVRITLKIRNMGVVQNSDSNVNAVGLDDIKYLRDTFNGYWESAVNNMYAYLKKNKKLFSEYIGCGECGKININAKYGNTGLWLG
jgi:hypothetical protein